MQARTLFDVLLVVMVGGVLVFELVGFGTGSGEGTTLDTIVTAVQNVDTIYYLVLAGILGVVFVSYVVIYIPHKQSQNTAR